MDYVIFHSDSVAVCSCGPSGILGLVVAVIIVVSIVAFPIIVTLLLIRIFPSSGGSKSISERYWLCPVLCMI